MPLFFFSPVSPCLQGVYPVKSYIERCSYLLFKTPFVCFPSFSGVSLHRGFGRYSHVTHVGSGWTDFLIGNSNFEFSGKHLKVLALPVACMLHGFLCDQSAQRKWKQILSGLFIASCIALSALIVVELIQHWTAPICFVVVVFFIMSLSLALICRIANINSLYSILVL